MDHGRGPFSMVRVHGTTSMVRLLKKIVLKALGPSLGVNRMWTKKNDHAPKSAWADFFNTCTKRIFLEKNQVWPFSCLLLDFTYLHFLLNVSKMWLFLLPTICRRIYGNWARLPYWLQNWTSVVRAQYTTVIPRSYYFLDFNGTGIPTALGKKLPCSLL